MPSRTFVYYYLFGLLTLPAQDPPAASSPGRDSFALTGFSVHDDMALLVRAGVTPWMRSEPLR